MSLNYRLATSYWPRSGYNQTNCSHASIPGAIDGRIVLEIELPCSKDKAMDYHTLGCVITDTMTFRVICCGVLSAITTEGEVLWSVVLHDNENQRIERYSSPVALEGGMCLVSIADDDSVRIYDQHGECVEEYVLSDMIDDSGIPPNITSNGHIILGGMSGDVFRIDGPRDESLGDFGYDILTPAIYPDNSLAIAGYYGTGFCRVSAAGVKIWNTDFSEADLLPSINKESVCAVGSLNEDKSAFYSSEGELIGSYNRASIFAEYSSDAWIAISDKYIAKLTVFGKEIWGYQLHDSGINNQPIVDNRGYVYLIDNGHLLCLNGNGEFVFKTHMNTNSIAGLCCISPGKMACVTTGKLVIIE